jgi:hypothetical protein
MRQAIAKSWNANIRGRHSIVDLLIRVACFCKIVHYIFDVKRR